MGFVRANHDEPATTVNITKIFYGISLLLLLTKTCVVLLDIVISIGHTNRNVTDRR